jgi:hypothetical protein
MTYYSETSAPVPLHTATGPVGRWQIRILSREPWLIENSEIIFRPTLREVLERVSTQVRRTSYMVGQPNREVLWAVDRWNYAARRWEPIINGKSRLRKGAGPS